MKHVTTMECGSTIVVVVTEFSLLLSSKRQMNTEDDELILPGGSLNIIRNSAKLNIPTGAWNTKDLLHGSEIR